MTNRRVIVDHVDLLVENVAVSRRFYRAALQPLGLGIISETETHISFGVDGIDDFGIKHAAQPTRRAHVAFVAGSRRELSRFFTEATSARWSSCECPGSSLQIPR